jgi:hypothetical protein
LGNKDKQIKRSGNGGSFYDKGGSKEDFWETLKTPRRNPCRMIAESLEKSKPR